MKYYDNDDDLYTAFENGCRSGNITFDVDENEISSSQDFFDAWKFATGRSSHSDYYWEDEDTDDDD